MTSWMRLPKSVGGGARRLLTQSLILRDIAALMLGGALGQVITLATIPLQAHYYAAEEIGRYATVLAVTNIGVVIFTLRAESVLASLADSKDRSSFARGIFSFIVWVFLCTQLLSALVAKFGLFPASLVLWLPLTSFVTALFTLLTQVCVLTGQLTHIARRNLFSGIATAAAQVSLGFTGVGSGLVLGWIMGKSLGAATMLSRAENSKLLSLLSPKQTVQVLGKYRQAVITACLGSVVNVAGASAVPLLIAAQFGAAATGAFALAWQSVYMPATFFAVALGQVLLSRVTREASAGSARRAVRQILVVSTFSSAVIVISSYLVGSSMDQFTQNGVWLQAKPYFLPVSIVSAAALMGSPLHSIWTWRGMFDVATRWAIWRLVMTFFIFLVSTVMHLSPIACIWLLAAQSVCLYAWSIRSCLARGLRSPAIVSGSGRA